MFKNRSFVWMLFHLMMALLTFSFFMIFTYSNYPVHPLFLVFYGCYATGISLFLFFYYGKNYYFFERKSYVPKGHLHPATKRSYSFHIHEILLDEQFKIKDLKVTSDGRIRHFSYELSCPCGFVHKENKVDKTFMGCVHELMMDKCPKCQNLVPKECLKWEEMTF